MQRNAITSVCLVAHVFGQKGHPKMLICLYIPRHTGPRAHQTAADSEPPSTQAGRSSRGVFLA
eukprot:scaffold37520_cov17-Tisochrysis_lutea.AAC.2